MELLLLFIGLPVLFDFFLGLIISVIAVSGYLVLLAVYVAVRFWYVSVVVLLLLVAPLLYLGGLLLPLFCIAAVLALLVYFVPLSDEQKAKIEQAKIKANIQLNN